MDCRKKKAKGPEIREAHDPFEDDLVRAGAGWAMMGQHRKPAPWNLELILMGRGWYLSRTVTR